MKGVEGMEIPNPVSMFDARHGDNTDVLLALLTQNKELEGELMTRRRQSLSSPDGVRAGIRFLWVRLLF